MSDSVSVAKTREEYEAIAGLVREYVAWCRGRFGNEAWLIDEVLTHQALERELKDIAVEYGPPNGRSFLARSNGELSGCGAYRKLSEGICEMKRLYVPDRFRGRGLGRKICQALIAAAREDGYRLMRLDTANLMTEAIAMYESIGFRPCAPYKQYPERLMR